MQKNMTDPFRKMLDERFGMFVHYGLYTGFEGYYHGKEIKGCAEWIQRFGGIPLAEYEQTGRETFCPSPDFARNLVRSAKQAGVRYIVLTSKHHDGFCLFKTEVSDYNSYDFFGRDLCRELVDACNEEGLQVGFYYSHTLDWHEKDAGGNYLAASGRESHNRNWLDFPDDNIDFEKYFREKCLPQIREILTNYGPVNLIWFDYPHDITKEQSVELRDLVKSLQPDCQINSRISHGLCDYQSLADNALPVAPTGLNMECLITLNDSWGYHRGDNNWKTAEDTVGVLCRTLTSDSTLLMNVGPMPDGSLTAETEKILADMGEWTKRNSDAVYGRITGNPFSTVFSWGYASQKDKKLFLYVKDNNIDKITLPGIAGEIKSVCLLGSDAQIGYEFNENILNLKLEKTDMLMPVYAIEFEDTPVYNKEIMQCGDEISLGILWAGKVSEDTKDKDFTKLSVDGDEYCEGYGKNGAQLDYFGFDTLAFWTKPEEIICWDAYFSQKGEYAAELIHRPLDEGYGSYSLTLGDVTNYVDMKNEKNRFRVSKTSVANIRICRDGGHFEVNAPGKYRIMLKRESEGENLPVSEVRFTLVR